MTCPAFARYTHGMAEQDTQPLGRGMLIAAWVLILGLLAWFFTGVLEKQQNPNQQVYSQIHADGIREVRLERNRYGHYVSSGTINGQPVVFLLDTGATTISIPGSVARQLHLQPGLAYSVSTANGTIQVYATRLDTLTLGDIELHDVQANINPHMHDDQILLGMAVLKKLEMIQQGNILTLRQYPGS